MAKTVRSTTVNYNKDVRYFAVILDCSPDKSHQEQMSLTFRYVSDGAAGAAPVIHEHFITILVVNETTGQNLLDVLLKELENLGLDFFIYLH